jgi:queuosine precursor transporter
MFKSKRELVFIILAGIFITNAVVAELIGGKIIQIHIGSFGPFIMSVGIIPWPVVFLTTDLMNEYYGKTGVRRLSIITASLFYMLPLKFLQRQVYQQLMMASFTQCLVKV